MTSCLERNATIIIINTHSLHISHLCLASVWLLTASLTLAVRLNETRQVSQSLRKGQDGSTWWRDGTSRFVGGGRKVEVRW